MGRVLIVLTGPIASGKSTVARAVSREFERHGTATATVDLDIVYDMLEHDGARKDDDELWATVRQAALALALAFLADGIGAVIVEGGLPVAGERARVADAVPAGVEVRHITLWASFATACDRVDADPTRTYSRDRDLLRREYDDADAAHRDLPADDLLLDTETITAEQAARTIVEWALDVRA
jgi:adenylylsulfate kinase-like enzyme